MLRSLPFPVVDIPADVPHVCGERWCTPTPKLGVHNVAKVRPLTKEIAQDKEMLITSIL